MPESDRLIILADLMNKRFESISFAPFLRWLIDILPADLLDIVAEEFSLGIYEVTLMLLSDDKNVS